MTTTEQAKQVSADLREYRNYKLICTKAADTIDALVAENERLREALEIAAASNAWQNFGSCRAFDGDFRTPSEVDEIARAALGEKS